MPGHGLQARGIAREQKMIYAGMTLFLEQGYERTTTAQIARKAGCLRHRFSPRLGIKRRCCCA